MCPPCAWSRRELSGVSDEISGGTRESHAYPETRRRLECGARGLASRCHCLHPDDSAGRRWCRVAGDVSQQVSVVQAFLRVLRLPELCRCDFSVINKGYSSATDPCYGGHIAGSSGLSHILFSSLSDRRTTEVQSKCWIKTQNLFFVFVWNSVSCDNSKKHHSLFYTEIGVISAIQVAKDMRTDLSEHSAHHVDH
ncbi:uncharacterized protein LOC112565269 [Pomacea canaliculata]|uniref:uncharacterized protein LOC112565269 n=1 Tax=Pomacea canaliculata TaxID=400727 RepID=UPI000D738ADA|nr:uncharacterized protein LOC112565269 [Pomacea canaliculata]